MKATPIFKVGQTVEYKSAGKVARCEGKAGQMVRGRVTQIYDDNDPHLAGCIAVLPFHRCIEGSAFKDMESAVDKKKAKIV